MAPGNDVVVEGDHETTSSFAMKRNHSASVTMHFIVVAFSYRTSRLSLLPALFNTVNFFTLSARKYSQDAYGRAIC